MPDLSPPLRLAQEMGASLGRGPILLTAMPAILHAHKPASIHAMTRHSPPLSVPQGGVAWQPGRSAGLSRLEAFLPVAGRTYASSRNVDFGRCHRTNVSALSPWIRHRLILEPEVLRRTLTMHRFCAAEKFIQEIFWRTYSNRMACA